MRRLLSTLIVDVSQFYFMMRAINIFTEFEIMPHFIQLLRQGLLVTQTFVTIMYWTLLHNNNRFEVSPLLWFGRVWQHGVPLFGLLIEQLLVPIDFTWESLGFTIICA